ncbi:MAG: M20/M25/M40 family metallo-hydrolase [Chitinophagales bacterium]
MKKNYYLLLFLLASGLLWGYTYTMSNSNEVNEDQKMIRAIYSQVLEKGECYEDLRYLCKDIGGRLTASPQAAAAVEWGAQTLEQLGSDRVEKQAVMVPHWVRGEKEEARVISEHIGWESVNIAALGNSIGTPKMGITAPVVEVENVEELEKMSRSDVSGKIVLNNIRMPDHDVNTFDSYSSCSSERYTGASAASRLGAKGYILRSLGHFIDEHPHTGNSTYEDGVAKIPMAAISTKHAELLSGLLEVDKNTKLHMKMNCETFPDRESYNVIGEIKGTEKPDEIILVSGHLDSWDNGEGAHDDGSGVVQSIEVLRTFKALGIQPKRTIRCVLWMNEENGAMGAKEYAKVSEEKGENHIVAIESDRGGFVPRGFTADAQNAAFLKEKLALLQSWQPLFEEYMLHTFEKGFSGVDVKFLKPQGTLCMGLIPDPQRYFDYHHTPNDTFDKVNKRELEMGAASMAALVYLFSEYGLEQE